jgi:hypothetical protein
MKRRTRLCAVAALWGLAAFPLTGAASEDCPTFASVPPGDSASVAGALPETRRAGDIEYVTGGIGIDEARAMREAVGDYPVTITFVSLKCPSPQFASGVQVRIESGAGQPLLQVKTNGPYLFLKLPPGDYRLNAQSDLGADQHRRFRVVKGHHTELRVGWPGNMAASAAR